MSLITENDFEIFGDCTNHLEVMNSNNNFYVIMKLFLDLVMNPLSGLVLLILNSLNLMNMQGDMH